MIGYCCSGGLRDWTDDDVPWEQHAMWHNKCAYLQLMKGPGFIKAALQGRPRKDENLLSSPSPPPVASIKLNENKQHTCEDDTHLCKVCLEKEYDTVFSPCGHVVACAKCASSLLECPSCRVEFEHVTKIYFS